MHLTNYAINKNSADFVQPEDLADDGSHKRTVSSLMATLRAEGHDTTRLWQLIGELCVKTLISVQPHLEHTYYSCRQRSDDPGFGCFELLGFDVMIDHKLRPFLIEVNHSPSFTCDSPLERTLPNMGLGPPEHLPIWQVRLAAGPGGQDRGAARHDGDRHLLEGGVQAAQEVHAPRPRAARAAARAAAGMAQHGIAWHSVA